MKEVTLEGAGKLNKKFMDLIQIVDDREMELALMKPARILRDEIKNRAPKGPTGNLKRGVVAKRFSRKIKGQPAVFVAMDYKIAPHSHLVEYGHGGPHPAGPHPFFRPTVDKKKAETQKEIAKNAWNLIKKKANK